MAGVPSAQLKRKVTTCELGDGCTVEFVGSNLAIGDLVTVPCDLSWQALLAFQFSRRFAVLPKMEEMTRSAVLSWLAQT